MYLNILDFAIKITISFFLQLNNLLHIEIRKSARNRKKNTFTKYQALKCIKILIFINQYTIFHYYSLFKKKNKCRRMKQIIVKHTVKRFYISTFVSVRNLLITNNLMSNSKWNQLRAKFN